MRTEIIIKKLTDESVLRRACDMTRKPGMVPSQMTLEKIYRCEHSPIRTQQFWIELRGIETFVSVHLVRHNVGVTHFVESNREDNYPRPEGSTKVLLGLTKDGLHQVFDYKEGQLFWKIKPRRSTAKIGDSAGTFGASGRCEINFQAKRAHRYRVIFLMHHGWCPPIIDHINGDPSDDRIANLRPATKQQNAANSKLKEGLFKGVTLHHTGKFVAQICIDGSHFHLGNYETAEEAAVAYDKAALENFGDFARINFPDTEKPITREDQVNHGMYINAQALINMSLKRLCYASHGRTVATYMKLKKAMKKVDPALSDAMVPACVYRNGICPELRECKPGLAAVLRAYAKEK